MPVRWCSFGEPTFLLLRSNRLVINLVGNISHSDDPTPCSEVYLIFAISGLTPRKLSEFQNEGFPHFFDI